MGIKRTTPKQAIEHIFKEAQRITKECITNELIYLGEECNNRIRDRKAKESWCDQTGNLRSSIGYAVLQDGQEQIRSAFQTVMQGAQGASMGKRYLASLTSLYVDTYALVVVAGMDYAQYVEAIESKDVLESTRIWAQSVVNKRLEKAKEVAIKKINALSL